MLTAGVDISTVVDGEKKEEMEDIFDRVELFIDPKCFASLVGPSRPGI